MKTPDHFEGKSAFEHLKQARAKGASAASEIHGSEPSGSLIAFCDASKTAASLLVILLTLLAPFSPSPTALFCTLIISSLALLIWLAGRSALLGWFRLERLHRLIEEERYEIEHHREQEREELTAMYQSKGLSGKLLTEVIDVLMADDNRLLSVMLEEELGLSLEAYEHPLKQSLGAAFGTLSAAVLIAIGMLIAGPLGALLSAFIFVGVTSAIMAQNGGNQKVRYTIWNLGLLFITYSTVYFLSQLGCLAR